MVNQLQISLNSGLGSIANGQQNQMNQHGNKLRDLSNNSQNNNKKSHSPSTRPNGGNIGNIIKNRVSPDKHQQMPI